MIQFAAIAKVRRWRTKRKQKKEENTDVRRNEDVTVAYIKAFPHVLMQHSKHVVGYVESYLWRTLTPPPYYHKNLEAKRKKCRKLNSQGTFNNR